MSMKEYEKQNNNIEDLPLPEDFSEEDVAFAQELGTLFSPQEEIIPPYFAQTLLEAEDPRYTAVDTAFVQKTSARVFRSLKLRRRLYSHKNSKMSMIGEAVREIVARKSLLAWAATLILIMMFTVAFTAPSFEQGITMLLHGSRTGVLQMKQYPGKVQPRNKIFHDFDARPEQNSLLVARQLLHFNIYWPQTIPTNYLLSTINIYQVSNAWADGPIVELVYEYNSAGPAPEGTGQIVIREFKPIEQVLQVVEDGNAYPIAPDQYGNPTAIYVDGQWLPPNKMQQHLWSKGTRSEVIYQQDGVVFWIAGDQRDGMNKKVLWNVAQSMQVVSFINHAMLRDQVTILDADNSGTSPFANDVLSVSDNGPDGQYYVTMSSYIAGMDTPATSKTSPHGQ